MKILSIIIPSYNTEKHIDRCVPYFLKTKNINDMEIIFIDDGSTDNTAKYLKRYASLYPDSVRVVSKNNGGHGSAVNRGIKEATGKYFKVVDGDDWVESNNLDRLIDSLSGVDADLVLNPYYKESQITGKRTIHGNWNVKKNATLKIDEIPENIYGLQLHEWTIKTELLKNHNIYFTENCYYDDFEYITFPVPFIKTVIFFDFPVYNYLIDQASQSVSDHNVFKNSWMSKKILFDTIKFYGNHRPDNRRADRYFLDTVINGCKQHYNIYLRNGHRNDAFKKCLDFDEDLSRYADLYERVGKRYFYISFIRRFGIIGFKINFLLLRLYKRIGKRIK